MGFKFIPVDTTSFPFFLFQNLITGGYSTFVETGTYHGTTAIRAAEFFDEVYTIEASELLFEKSKEKCKEQKNIHLCLGDSREELEKILQNAKSQKIIFWLDAHYSGGPTHLNSSPILDELKIINLMTNDSIIVVDDARFIHSVFEGERYCEYGPFFNEILKQNRYVSCVDDAFIAVPYGYRELVDAYAETFSRWQSKVLKECVSSNKKQGNTND